VIESLSATYGVPLLRHTRTASTVRPAGVLADKTVVAQWEDAASLLTLTRGTYSPQFQLALISKTLNPRARTAIKEAVRPVGIPAETSGPERWRSWSRPGVGPISGY
jgi:hypothetical protein